MRAAERCLRQNMDLKITAASPVYTIKGEANFRSDIISQSHKSRYFSQHIVVDSRNLETADYICTKPPVD